MIIFVDTGYTLPQADMPSDLTAFPSISDSDMSNQPDAASNGFARCRFPSNATITLQRTQTAADIRAMDRNPRQSYARSIATVPYFVSH
jgi:hypothetical protein